MWPDNITLGVFPEYCWGFSESMAVLKHVEEFINELPDNLTLVLGTTNFDTGDGYNTNNAIIINDKRKFVFIPKSHTLAGERKLRHVENGVNPGVISSSGIRIGVLVCADLWDAELVKRLVIDENADLLAVPAFTTVPKGYAAYSKQQWLSLSITRSREFVVPLIIADHAIDREEYDVGKATNIADPSKKHEDMNNFSDFLDLPQNNTIISKLDFEAIQRYRDYRISSGILSYQ